MVAHSTVEEQDTTTTTTTTTTTAAAPSSSPSSPSRPRDTSALLSTPHSPPSSSVSQLHRQHPSNQCVASPIPVPDQLDHQPLLDPVPTHFPPFRCQVDFLLITRTASMLEHSGFYWGPLGVEEAHRRLKDVATGTFLIRDSRQKDIFFTLSYRAASGPVSVRIVYKGQRFSLAGSEHSFPCFFLLLEHYMNCSKKSLSVPYRKQRPTLQELCRKRVAESCGGDVERIARVPVNIVLKHFLLEFPYRI